MFGLSSVGFKDGDDPLITQVVGDVQSSVPLKFLAFVSTSSDIRNSMTSRCLFATAIINAVIPLSALTFILAPLARSI